MAPMNLRAVSKALLRLHKERWHRTCPGPARLLRALSGLPKELTRPDSSPCFAPRHSEGEYTAQDDSARAARLVKAQQEVNVKVDDDRGDVQVFNALRLERQKKEEQEKARLEKLKALQPNAPEPNKEDPNSQVSLLFLATLIPSGIGSCTYYSNNPSLSSVS